MNIEGFVFLGIVLLVWFLASVGSWLRQQIEQHSQTQDQDAAIVYEESSASPESGEFGPILSEAMTDGIRETSPESSGVVVRKRSQRSATGRLRYRSQKAARRGIILITVFGPCKALEPGDTFG